MSPGFWIAVLIIGPVVVFVVWLVLVDAAIRIEPGTLGLMLRRGAATGRVLEPGRHFVLPFRKVLIQRYPSRELSYVAGSDSGESASENDYVDVAVPVTFGDRTAAVLSYTLRCRLDRDMLKDVHDRFGPEGIWAVIRDDSRRSLIDACASSDVSADDVYGDRFAALQERLGGAVRDGMADTGFEVVMFNLRHVDLGATGHVVQAIARSRFELDLEQARASVRRAMVEHDAALGDARDASDDLAIRYRQLEAWQDVLERWNGGSLIPAALTTPLLRDIARRTAESPVEAARDRDADRAGDPPASEP